MSLKDILQISSKNIRVYFRRSFMIIMVMGIIFGLIFAVNLCLCGIMNMYIEMSSTATDGKTIVIATNNADNIMPDGATPIADRADMVRDIESYGGEVFGDVKKFGTFGSVILPEQLVKNYIKSDIKNAPEDAAPVLASTFLGDQLLGIKAYNSHVGIDEKKIDYEKFRNDLIGKTFEDINGAKYYVVGLSPGSFHINNLSLQQVQSANNEIINPVLEYISISPGMPIIIDNGNSKKWQVGEGGTGNMGASSNSIIAAFDNKEYAYEYFMNGYGAFPNMAFSQKTYSVAIVAGTSPETLYIFNLIKTAVNIASIILGLIASVVVIFTSIRLVDQDRQSIELYRNLGATPKQIRIIYLFYFLELMLFALLFAFVLASLVLTIFNLSRQDLLSTQAMFCFNLPNPPQVFWYGLNVETFIVAATMLCLAPICVLINNKRMR